MTKKFLALTMVLVLAAGFAAVAAENNTSKLTGNWNNTITLDPTQTNSFAGLTSKLDVTYTANGITYTSLSKFNKSEFTKQQFGVSTSVGLLDLTSTLNMDPSGGNLRFWESGADLTVGGVNIGGDFYLQKHDWAYSASSGYEASFWPEYTAATVPPSFGTPSSQTGSYVLPYDGDSGEYGGAEVNVFSDYGSGLELTFSGETPGGVSVDVTNTFGMMPTSAAESQLNSKLADKVETFIVNKFSLSSFSDWSDVAAKDVIGQLDNQAAIAASGTSYNNEDVVKAWLASQLDVPATSSYGVDGASIGILAEDWNTYTSQSDVYPGNASSDVSADVRDAYVSALKGSLTISGIAADTGKVVNTGFDVAGAQYDWTVTPVDGTTDASVAFGLEKAEVGPSRNGGTSLGYYSTLVKVDNLSIGGVDFSNKTKFTKNHGFAYTKFGFSMSNKDFPISIAATLKWDNTVTPGGKSVSLTPSLSADWANFTVYTDLSTSDSSTVIEGMEVEGFEISAKLGEVNVTSITALGSDNVDDLVSGYHAYDEVLSIDKLASTGDLDLGIDVYSDMEGGLIPKAIDGSASYPISDQFDLGTSLALTKSSGLQELSLSLDYSF